MTEKIWKCSVFCPASAYRSPGQCQNPYGIQSVKMGKAEFLACSTHRQKISDGRKMKLIPKGER